jgi:hypothetical protein
MRIELATSRIGTHIKHMPCYYFPEDVSEAQTVCALRFLGYEYENSINANEKVPKVHFIDIIQPIVDSLELHDNQNHNFAAFFGLQRFLHKWGGERLTKYSAEHIAYDFLFLNLYRQDPPAEFSEKRYCDKWDSDFREQAERHAAFVRKSFRRIGRGKSIAD